MTVEFEVSGSKCMIDEIDADLLSICKWTVYKNRNTKYVKYSSGQIELPTLSMHRLILGRVLGRDLLQNEEVDHKNLNGLDNTRGNLRLATSSQNAHNRSRRVDNTTGCKGVSLNGKYYRVRVTVGGKRIDVGHFKTFEDARDAYEKAEREHNGEFARFD